MTSKLSIEDSEEEQFRRRAAVYKQFVQKSSFRRASFCEAPKVNKVNVRAHAQLGFERTSQHRGALNRR